MMTNLIPKRTKVKVDPDRLTDSQKEIIRCLLNGRYIFVDWREKYRMSREFGSTDDVKSGHGNNHLYRPTILFFIDEQIVIVDPRDTTHLILNPNYTGKYKQDVDSAEIETALGLSRNTDDKKRI